MPMRLKSELYKKEQEEIIEKIISILDLKNKNIYTLYELDKNEEIQNKIMELIPEIRKWFSFNGLKAKIFNLQKMENILEHTFIVLQIFKNYFLFFNNSFVDLSP